MCNCDIDDGPSVSWESNHVSIKTHTCCECGSQIDVGEKYWLLKGVWDGEFLTFKTCEICENIRIEAIAEGAECITLGCLYEEIGSKFEYAGRVI